jgi:radical SAM superfamily enzyme YgiQ (UPF0313 family)
LKDVVVIAPFRRPTFRTAISKKYPVDEPWDSPPLIITGELLNNGLSATYFPLINIFNAYNEDTDKEILEQFILDNPAKIYLFSSDHFIPSRSTASLYGMRILSRIIKSKNKNSIIGSIGRISTVLENDIFTEVEELDFSIVGEPEELIGNMINEILGEGLDSVNNKYSCFCLRGSIKKPEPAVIKDLENISLPAYEVLGPAFEMFEKYSSKKTRTIPFSIRTSLGCKFKCKFCSGVPNWLNYRKKSKEKVSAEIQHFKKHVGNKGYICFLEDEIFTRDVEHVRDITKVFKDNEIFLEGLYTHSTLLTEEIAQYLVPITNRVYIGLDNANDKILRKMAKGQNMDIVLSTIEKARTVGLKVHLEWIIGTPEEDVDSLIISLSTIFNLLNTGVVDNINTYVYCPHPGTEYAVNCKKYNINIVADLEDIQESGGIPASYTGKLSRNEIFSAYLISQLLIAEVKNNIKINGYTNEVTYPNSNELKRIFGFLKQNK